MITKAQQIDLSLFDQVKLHVADPTVLEILGLLIVAGLVVFVIVYRKR